MNPLLTLCALPAIEETEGSRGLRLADHDLLLVRRQDSYYLYRNRCPHRGINLEWVPDRFLDPEKVYIQCATHGALFTIDGGRCVSGPCAGQSLEAIPFVIEQGEIRVDPASLARSA